MVSRVSGRIESAVVAVCVVVLLSSACAMVPVGAPSVAPAVVVDRPCAAVAVRSCALPYPSDEFTVADASTSTGRRVVVPREVMSDRVLDRLGPGASPADAFAGADGFSALTPVIFELASRIVPGSVPADGGDVVAVFDVETGARVPIRVEVPADAARHGAPDTIVVAWPVERYEFGHTYVARITDGVHRPEGGSPERSPGLDDGSGPQMAAVRGDLAQVEGDRWSSLLSVTRFTVRSAKNATAELDAMASIARAADHPVRNVRVDLPLLVQHASAVVVGEVSLSDFRDADGVARAANGATDQWVKFLMVLPERAAGPNGAPVVIYGHGLTVAKETMLISASKNAELGLATIGIDVPNHGDRQGGEGGHLLDLATPRAFGRLASMPLQGIIDHVSLLGAVQDHVGELDLRVPTLVGPSDELTPALDVDTILYQGTSMGGVLGAAFVALAPELDGAFLQVAGSGIADTIFHSLLWPLFMGVVPSSADTGDAYALMGAATMLLDHADNTNLVERIRDRGTPLFLAYGVGDGVLPNYVSDRMIALVDLPLVGPQLTPIGVSFDSTGSDAIPADGTGAAQIWPNSSAELQSFAAHIAFGQARPVKLLEEWLTGRLAAEGVTG